MPLDIGNKTITYSLFSGERVTIHYRKDDHTKLVTLTLIGEVPGHYRHPAHDIGALLHAAGSDIMAACKMNYLAQDEEDDR
jgi:hypothetical protein